MPKIIENLPEKLLDEARRQVQQSGYGALTIRSVAKSCGVGVGTVYNYYDSKDALVAAFMLSDWMDALDAIRSCADTAETAVPVLQAIHEQLTAFWNRHEGVFRDAAAAGSFAGSFSRYHSVLRSQLTSPLRRFCPDDFTAEFLAEAMLTWTVSGKSFGELLPMMKKIIN